MTPDASDIKTSFYKGNFEECIDLIKILADEGGDAVAADIYGDILMSGVWDTRKMEVDLARGRLQPQPTDSETDTYLILARDPLKAVQYYKQASDYFDQSENSTVKLLANAKLEYCRSKGLAGFKESHISIPKLKYSIARFLDTNAKSFNESSDLESTHDFVPIPNARPHVENPFAKIFKRIGKRFRNRCIIQIALAQMIALLAYFYSYWSNAFLLSLSVFLSISAPLTIFAIIGHFKGYKKGLPICCCSKISNAYELSVKSLPVDCKPQRSPFETTPAYIRCSQTMKAIYFWLYILISVVRVLQIIINFQGGLSWLSKLADYDAKGVLFYTVPVNFLLISLFIVFWDKNFNLSNIESVFGEHEGSSALIYVLITLFVSILAHDQDCQRESEKLKEKSHLQILIETKTI
jgi:hypothetical protein